MKGYLLDTHAFIMWVDGNERMPVPIRDLIAGQMSRVHFSVVSAWEISIKASLKKLTAPVDLPGFFAGAVQSGAFDVISVDMPHAIAVRDLPLHHRDPFDRLLIAQAQVENLPIISNDRAFAAYDIEIIW